MDSLVLYCPDARWLARVRTALGMSQKVVACDAWQSFERAAPRGSCLLIVVEWLRGADLLDRVQQLRLWLPLHPLVLVTGKDADAVRELSHIVVDEIVWPHEVERSLAQVVRRAAARKPLERIAGLIERAPHTPAHLQAALLVALRASRPLASLGQVADAIGCDRRTLWRASRRMPGLELRLQDLLDWVLVLRLSGLKTPGRKWSTIALEVGLHEHSVARLIRRLTGLSLRAFVGLGHAGVLRRFEQEVLPQLLGKPVSDAGTESEEISGAAPAAALRRVRARTVVNA
jgi:hypothetical protein